MSNTNSSSLTSDSQTTDSQENSSQILNDIQSLQTIEQQLFNSLEENTGLTTDQQKKIVEKINNISKINSSQNNFARMIANNISTNFLKALSSQISSITTSSINLYGKDSNGVLTTNSTGTVLLFNNNPIISWTGIATSDLNMNNYSITNTNTLHTNNIATTYTYSCSCFASHTIKFIIKTIIGYNSGKSLTRITYNVKHKPCIRIEECTTNNYFTTFDSITHHCCNKTLIDCAALLSVT